MIRLLAIVALLQIVLVALLYWPRDVDTADRGALIDALERETVSRIAIRARDEGAVTLTRDGAGWVMDSGLPADGGKVAPLLDALLAQDPGFAIADSSAAAARFDVAADDFERRIEIAGESGTATVYLGSSPSFRKIHARRDGDSAVYVIELNGYDAPTDESDWLDGTLLAKEDPTRIGLYGVDYLLGDDGWQRADGEAVDATAMEELLQVLGSLRVSGIEAGEDEILAAAGEALRIDLSSGDSTSRLVLLDNPEEERFYLRSDRFEQTFGTSAYDAERLIDATRSVAGLADVSDNIDGDDEAGETPNDAAGPDAGDESDGQENMNDIGPTQ